MNSNEKYKYTNKFSTQCHILCWQKWNFSALFQALWLHLIGASWHSIGSRVSNETLETTKVECLRIQKLQQPRFSSVHIEFASHLGARLQWFASPVYTRSVTIRLWGRSQRGKAGRFYDRRFSFLLTLFCCPCGPVHHHLQLKFYIANRCASSHDSCTCPKCPSMESLALAAATVA